MDASIAPAAAPAPAPAYERVKAHIKAYISNGVWKPGDKVPSEAALMREFGISRMTAHRALRELAAQGLVTRVQGSGTRVAELHRISSRLSVRDIHEEVLERGHQHSTQVLQVAAEPASEAVAQALDVSVGSEVYHTVLLHLENGLPIQHEDRYVNPAAAPGYLDLDFHQITPTRHLLSCAPLTEASYTIEACRPSALEARQLRISRNEPCLLMQRRTISGTHVASIARLLHPGSRYSFGGLFQI